MIEQLLRFLTEGGVHSYEALAQRLSISIPLLEMMLEDLSRLGYLRPVDSDCGAHCTSCSIGSCSITGPGRLWALTDKGAKAAAKLD
jgi:hypothetical protein